MKHDHWNVTGPNSISLQELFDKEDADFESCVDLLAERIGQLGGLAVGTVRLSAALSRLGECPLGISDGQVHDEAVVKALSVFAHEARSMIGDADEPDDAVTTDLFTEVARRTDKWPWFVESHSPARTSPRRIHITQSL